MTNFDKYKETFSQIQSNSKLNIEDLRDPKKKKGHLPSRKIKIAILVLTGLFGFGTWVHASGMFGLRNLLIITDEETTLDDDAASKGAVNHKDKTDDSGETEKQAVDNAVTPDLKTAISLQGYMGSDEYQASKEWNEFMSHYDPDFQKHTPEEENRIKKVAKEKWLMYSVYTQEMVDKLEEIAQKYGLILHRTNQTFSDNNEFDRMSRTSGLLGTANVVMDGYLYNDGTFQYDGESTKNAGRFSYQFRRCVKGTFDQTLLYLESEDIENYKEVVYRTARGQDVTISVNSKGKTIVIADLENSFVTLHIIDKVLRNGKNVGKSEKNANSSQDIITLADVKKVLDSFDFAKIDEIGSLL